MLTNLKRWAQTHSDRSADALLDAAELERRLSERCDFTGKQVRMMLGRAPHALHLKDVSCKGACGLTDAPVYVGQKVRIELNRDMQPLAEVRWVRKALIGVAFGEPLPHAFLRRYHSAHQQARAEPY